jgi:hypothetical protein
VSVSLGEFLVELVYLLTQLCHQLVSRIIVDDRFVGDHSRLGSICQSRHILLKEVVIGTDARNHKAVAVATD